MAVKEKLNFIKKNYQIVYSVVLIVFIPLAVIFNTVVYTQSFKRAIDQELYSKAIAIGDTINAGILEILYQPNNLQNRLEQIAKFNTEITSIDILEKDKNSDNFTVAASLDKSALGKVSADLQNVIAWHQGKPVAYLTTSMAKSSISQEISFTKQTERFWVVIMPLRDLFGGKQLLLSMKISLAAMDQITEEVLIRSYIILAITILIIILLLANNTRLFEYAALYRKLKEVDQMKDEFISMASHELRTPVTGIRGYVSMMLEGTLGAVSDKIRDNLKIVQSASERLAALVEDLLNVSRIEQGRMKFDLKQLEPEKIIKEILAELKIQADEKKLELNYKPHKESLPTLSLDVDRFKEILINLIGNAVKYTERGSVELATEEKEGGKTLEIRIKDTGIGMSAKARERLFEKFYRVQSDKTKSIPGTGLGLWITKQMVEQMRGQIMVDSIENVGTQITLNFPIVKK